MPAGRTAAGGIAVTGRTPAAVAGALTETTTAVGCKAEGRGRERKSFYNSCSSSSGWTRISRKNHRSRRHGIGRGEGGIHCDMMVCVA